MKILNILSSINGADSNSNRLVQAVNEQLTKLHPHSSIAVRDLAKNPLPHLDSSHFKAFGLAADARTKEDDAAVFHSDSAIAEIQSADIVVIGVPFYNFSIPGTLKSWIDHIVRAGVTFQYGAGGPKGLLTGKKVYLAIASGGIYSDEAMKAYDFAEPYLRFILGFIGLTDVTAFRIEGTKIPDMLDTAFEKASEELAGFAF